MPLTSEAESERVGQLRLPNFRTPNHIRSICATSHESWHSVADACTCTSQTTSDPSTLRFRSKGYETARKALEKHIRQFSRLVQALSKKPRCLPQQQIVVPRHVKPAGIKYAAPHASRLKIPNMILERNDSNIYLTCRSLLVGKVPEEETGNASGSL